MKVEGEGVSLTTSGRTRDSGFEECISKSELVNRHNDDRFTASRGSPPGYNK